MNCQLLASSRDQGKQLFECVRLKMVWLDSHRGVLKMISLKLKLHW